MQEIHQKAAQLLADKVNAAFESEKTLEAEFRKNYETLPFDRTEFWQGIIYNILRDSWLEAIAVKAEPTGYDRLMILKALHPLLDYNLYSQVLLNLQTYNGMAYQSGAASKEITRLQEAWPKEYKLDPFAPKARMVKQAEVISDEQKQYNTMISSLRALQIISQFNPDVSFRVTPKGRTPALADSRNISMIGEGGDKYLKTLPELAVWYLTWSDVPRMAHYKPNATPPNPEAPGILPHPEGMEFVAEGISYPFFSKSGGDVLHDVLFVRKLIYEIVRGVDISQENCTVLPRMNSILVVADKYGTSLKRVVEKLKTQYPMLVLTEGARV